MIAFISRAAITHFAGCTMRHRGPGRDRSFSATAGTKWLPREIGPQSRTILVIWSCTNDFHSTDLRGRMRCQSEKWSLSKVIAIIWTFLIPGFAASAEDGAPSWQDRQAEFVVCACATRSDVSKATLRIGTGSDTTGENALWAAIHSPAGTTKSRDAVSCSFCSDYLSGARTRCCAARCHAVSHTVL